MALRYPGRYLGGEDILPKELITFIGAQIGLSEKQLSEFTYKSVTRYEHLRTLQQYYGYQPFHSCETEFISWLTQAVVGTERVASSRTAAEAAATRCATHFRDAPLSAPG